MFMQNILYLAFFPILTNKFLCWVTKQYDAVHKGEAECAPDLRKNSGKVSCKDFLAFLFWFLYSFYQFEMECEKVNKSCCPSNILIFLLFVDYITYS